MRVPQARKGSEITERIASVAFTQAFCYKEGKKPTKDQATAVQLPICYDSKSHKCGVLSRVSLCSSSPKTEHKIEANFFRFVFRYSGGVRTLASANIVFRVLHGLHSI